MQSLLFLTIFLCSNNKGAKRSCLLGVLVTIYFFFHPPDFFSTDRQNKSILTFLDVGHGSSTLIEFADKIVEFENMNWNFNLDNVSIQEARWIIKE